MNYKKYNPSINQFYDANEGFTKGNLSKTIYKPYKDYKPRDVVASNEKDSLLLFILKCELAIQDLTLYLDIKESDDEILKMLNFYKKELKEAKEKYLQLYWPLSPCQITTSFLWNDCPFPWEA